MIVEAPVSVHLESKSALLDGITPIAAYEALRTTFPGASFLFESAPGANQTARYSIVGIGTLGEVVAKGFEVSLSIHKYHERFAAGQAFAAARQLLKRLAPANPLLHRYIGAYGVAAFELASYSERLPIARSGLQNIPDLHLVVPEAIVIFDHFTHIVSAHTLSFGRASFATPVDILNIAGDAHTAPLQPASHDLKIEKIASTLPYGAMVAQAKDAILAGEAFQIVLSQSWKARSTASPFSVYRALRSINPSPYMFYLDFGHGALLGSSPEALCRLDGRRATVRPLAGTRPRPAEPAAERAVASQLRRDPKERAEHVMLVDLGRNDLGRVCEYGSVRTTELLEVERYSHVMHLVSNVSGTLRRDCDAFDVFQATFPAGTVSGAPKIRAMELIAQLENRRRGYYAGSVVCFGFNGSLDSCITLRSAYACDNTYYVQAGAGIVADSDPAAEDAECRAKAEAVFSALRAVDGVAA